MANRVEIFGADDVVGAIEDKDEVENFMNHISGFSELMEKYGAEACVKSLPDEVFIQLFDFFLPADYD